MLEVCGTVLVPDDLHRVMLIDSSCVEEMLLDDDVEVSVDVADWKAPSRDIVKERRRLTCITRTSSLAQSSKHGELKHHSAASS